MWKSPSTFCRHSLLAFAVKRHSEDVVLPSLIGLLIRSTTSYEVYDEEVLTGARFDIELLSCMVILACYIVLQCLKRPILLLKPQKAPLS